MTCNNYKIYVDVVKTVVLGNVFTLKEHNYLLYRTPML